MPGFNIVTGKGRQPFHTVETLREHRWRIRTLGGNVDVIPLLAKNVDLPNIEFEIQEILGGFIHYKFAKSMKVGTVGLSFYETFETYRLLKEQWLDTVGNIEQGIQGHDRYKGPVELELEDGKGDTVYFITFNGAWPKSLELGTLNYESSELKLINMTCEFDFITQTFF
jgi:hypothetical protein